MEEDLSNAQDIYFSATDRLHQIGIEYFPINASGTLLSDAYNVHRLSSTRELIVKYPKDVSNNAFLYGGIEYELKGNNDTDKKDAHVMRDVPDVGDYMRSGISYLPGTKEEVENINALLKNENIKVKIYEGVNATEESLKGLSSVPTRILHIATHGFYNPKGRRTKFDVLFKNATKYSSLEDLSMNRSGLLMAGAGNSINGLQKNQYTQMIQIGFSMRPYIKGSSGQVGIKVRWNRSKSEVSFFTNVWAEPDKWDYDLLKAKKGTTHYVRNMKFTYLEINEAIAEYRQEIESVFNKCALRNCVPTVDELKSMVNHALGRIMTPIWFLVINI